MPGRPIRLAVEGCGHGTLHAIYASIAESSKAKGWESGPDLVIIGGDFQAVRNANDLHAMSVPAKYREIGDFWEYYAGRRAAPYLTVFIGGNHEASNHLFELYYGGWVAPNIYYLGAANVIRFGPLRIAALSGIWKGYNYRKPHYERLPYSPDDVKSAYHVRELDVRKLLQVRTQVDIGLSHDWPHGIEWLGNHKRLFSLKPLFRDDAEKGQLGNKAARYVLDRLRPRYWFSAHLHCKYTAVVDHGMEGKKDQKVEPQPQPAQQAISNDDEIEIALDDDDNEDIVMQDTTDKATESAQAPNVVPDDLRAQLPASFAKPSQQPPQPDRPTDIPADITNTKTEFLALDKCLPRRHFLQLIEVDPRVLSGSKEEFDEPPSLKYDPEWLSIIKAFTQELQLGDPSVSVSRADLESYPSQIECERKWIEENVVKLGRLDVPNNFQMTAPPYDESLGINKVESPVEYTNPQTAAFCELLGIENKFDMTEEERQVRMQSASQIVDTRQRHDFRGQRGGRRGRGRGYPGRGRGRGFRPY